ncbi:MAG TPA: hypothetical protein VN442_16150 [Bryobacteraceae bacterium]|nr:hypothetical protein [Bryobacteraceae bacterium]
MHLIRFLLVIVALVATGCSRSPEPFPPPEQRVGPLVEKPATFGAFIAMNDPHADAYILGDVSPKVEANVWRWTFRRPELQFQVPSAEGWKFVMDFAIAGATFERTGPVALSVSINGRKLQQQRYTKPGQYKMEFAVPPDALKAGALNHVMIEPDKVWISTDGTALGFILVSAGFRR